MRIEEVGREHLVMHEEGTHSIMLTIMMMMTIREGLKIQAGDLIGQP